MAFELEIDEAARERYFTEGGSLISVVPIGLDLEQGAYILTLTLDVGIGFEGHELRFWISELEDESERKFFSGLETKFMSASDRSAVLECILKEVGSLVALAQPACVTMFSATSDLPAAALLKYRRVGDSFAALGYSVEELQPLFGIRAWQFKAPSLLSS